jgi:hypothetical protein
MPVLVLLLLISAACYQGELNGPAGPTSAPIDTNVGGANDDECSPTLTSLASDVFAGACTASGCHGASAPAAALDLSGTDLAARLIGQASTCDGWPLVVAGDADSSLLVRKLTGDVPAECGDPMPPAGGLLPAKKVACVRAWIDALDPDAGVAPPDGCETCSTSSCIDLTVDQDHCGACDAACPSGASCQAGQCECPQGLALCAGRCVDTARDLTHCGACDAPCGAGALCSAGECACTGGLEACATGCSELASDPNNCGGCGTTCGAGELCTPSGCGTQADCGGLTVCGGACVNTAISFQHCGGCDAPCKPGQTCNDGTCACPDGGSSCDGLCVDPGSDELNCGTCGNVCPQGTACEQGECACAGGGAVCGTACVDLQSDEQNCGTCGKTCAPGQACSSGMCACSDRAVSYDVDVAPVLAQNCTNAGCHAGVKAKAELDLNLAKSYAEIVSVEASQCSDGRLLVAPSDPSSSYLLQKILGVEMCSGSQMPKAGVSLPAADLEALSAWICQGAPR